MQYNIISTGSKGNAVVINGKILIDCGVPFVKLKDSYKNIQLVLLTHIHGDHFNKATIKKLGKERPTLRFACCEWLVANLIECGINKKNIDVLEIGTTYNFNICKVVPILLYHNVPQCGYRIFIEDKKMIYATDTNNLDSIEAKGYDYYLIEANYTKEGMEERIKEKELMGVYIYEYDAMLNHLSKEKCDEFLITNAGDNSQYEYMHQHKEKEVNNE